MNREQIIQAWRDQDYFLSLSDQQRASLPENPVGMIELSREALANVLGASHETCWVSCHPYSTECCPSVDCSSCFSGGALCCC